MNRFARVGLAGLLSLSAHLVGCADPQSSTAAATKAPTVTDTVIHVQTTGLGTCDISSLGEIAFVDPDYYYCGLNGEWVWIGSSGATGGTPTDPTPPPTDPSGTGTSDPGTSDAGTSDPGPTGSDPSSDPGPTGPTGGSGNTSEGDGHTWRMRLVEQGPSEECPAGGQAVSTGYDLDESGTLDTENADGVNEVTNSWVTCYVVH